MTDILKVLLVTIVYGLFFSLIAFATYYTGSAWCLWGLLLAPDLQVKIKTSNKE